MVQSAVQVLSKTADSLQRVVRINFQNEEGLGEGPVKEFFTLLSKQIQEDERIFLPNQNQFFVSFAEMKDNDQKEEIQERCKLIGRLIGKAIIDNRILDLCLSPLSWAQIFGTDLSNLSV